MVTSPEVIQQRYGWTDDTIERLGLRRFIEITRAVLKERREKERERWQLAAFIGWQVSAPFAEKDQALSFGQYLEQFGLGDKAPEPPKPPKPTKTAKELIAWANALTEKARKEKEQIESKSSAS